MVEFISLAVGIYQQLENGSEPAHFPENMLPIFKQFKNAYDSKDITKLGKLISKHYKGTLLDLKTKQEFTKFFGGMFERVPRFLNLNLSITIYQITENQQDLFEAVIDFKTNMKFTIIPLPFTDYDSGRVCITLKPEGEYRIWQITRIDSV